MRWLPSIRNANYEVSAGGDVRNRNTGRVLRARPLPSGYLRVPLTRAETDVYVHVLVLETFVGKRPTAMHQASHKDGNPANNKLSNLCWELPSANNRRKVAHGTAMFGEKNGMGKKTHCLRGHPFNEKNTRRANGKRICRTCARDHMRQRRAVAKIEMSR